MTTQRVDAPQRDPWLVLRTRSHHENIVERSLRQKEINSYLPRHSRVRRTKKCRTTLEVPLFPGYVFVQPGLDQLQQASKSIRARSQFFQRCNPMRNIVSIDRLGPACGR
jgi:transcription antitermination factor NusG